MHLNEAPGSAAAFCTAAENRFPPSLPAGERSGLVWLEKILLHNLSHLQVFIRPFRQYWWVPSSWYHPDGHSDNQTATWIEKIVFVCKKFLCWDHFDHKQHHSQDGRYSIQECRQEWRWVSIYSVFIALFCYMLSVSTYIIFISKAQYLSTSKMMEVAFLLWKKSSSRGLLTGASDNNRFCQDNSRHPLEFLCFGLVKT